MARQAPPGATPSGVMTRPAELQVGGNEPDGNGRPRWMTAQDELCEVGDARRYRHGVAGHCPGPPLAVPLLVRRSESVTDIRRELELCRQASRERGMTFDHAADLAMARTREPEGDAEPLDRRTAGADQAHPRNRGSHTPQLMVVLPRLHRDVVTEPLRLLIRVGVTADVDQKRGVVDRRSLLRVQPSALGDAKRDQALAQHMLHRLAEPEVDAQRERSHQFGQPNGLWVIPSHCKERTEAGVQASRSC